jgi:glycosyltransferase involved in cell wall biosynthesis
MIRALLLTPTAPPQLTGNAVTVDRISRGLKSVGILCRIIDLSQNTTAQALKIAGAFKPDLVHNFHAFKAGPAGLMIKESLGIPMITTMTGTDINIDFQKIVKRKVILEVLRCSEFVTMFSEQIRHLVRQRVEKIPRVCIIHQSILLPQEKHYDFRKRCRIKDDNIVFLLYGAIRKVKQWPYAIDLLESVRKVNSNFQLILAGPVLEENEYRRIKRMITDMPWAVYLGPIERHRVGPLMETIDIMLNTSMSECESNAMMEAMSHGKLVIGRNIPGNASLLKKETGITFLNKNDLREKIIFVMSHPDHIHRIGRKAAWFLQQRFSYEKEINSYGDIYCMTLRKKNFSERR